MTMWLLALSVLLNIAQPIPYILETIHGKARPNMVSWSTWTLLTAIGSAAAFSHGEWQTGWIIAANGISTASIVLLGLWHGYAKMTWLDGICQIAALIGLATWPFLHDPTAAVIVVVCIDAIAWVPTLRHAYVSPQEETWQSYALFLLSSVCGLLTLADFTITSALYIVYLIIADGTLTFLILWRRHMLATRAE